MNSDKKMRVEMRIVGVFILFVSLIFSVMFSIGSEGSFICSILAAAGLFSVISGIGVIFLRNWARLYSLIFLPIATVVFLFWSINDYLKTKFLISLLLQGTLSLFVLALVISLLGSKVRGQFK